MGSNELVLQSTLTVAAEYQTALISGQGWCRAGAKKCRDQGGVKMYEVTLTSR